MGGFGRSPEKIIRGDERGGEAEEEKAEDEEGPSGKKMKEKGGEARAEDAGRLSNRGNSVSPSHRYIFGAIRRSSGAVDCPSSPLIQVHGRK